MPGYWEWQDGPGSTAGHWSWQWFDGTEEQTWTNNAKAGFWKWSQVNFIVGLANCDFTIMYDQNCDFYDNV